MCQDTYSSDRQGCRAIDFVGAILAMYRADRLNEINHIGCRRALLSSVHEFQVISELLKSSLEIKEYTVIKRIVSYPSNTTEVFYWNGTSR